MPESSGLEFRAVGRNLAIVQAALVVFTGLLYAKVGPSKDTIGWWIVFAPVITLIGLLIILAASSRARAPYRVRAIWSFSLVCIEICIVLLVVR